jgi:hypothetical protein
MGITKSKAVVRLFFSFTIAAMLAGCAPEVVRSPASLTPATGTNSTIEIDEDALVVSSSGYQRIVPAGSKWELRGLLPQGKVYRRLDGVFTIEGAQIHEGFIVVSGNQLVGFYLPVEQAFSPTRPVMLIFK